jgi:hypothetical protein
MRVENPSAARGKRDLDDEPGGGASAAAKRRRSDGPKAVFDELVRVERGEYDIATHFSFV